MKLRFENDAVFKKNITINKTLTASQIEEPVDRENVTTTYQKQEEAIIDVVLSEELPPRIHSFLFNLTLPADAFNLLVVNCKARITYNENESGLLIPKEEVVNAQTTVDEQAQTINASVKHIFTDNTDSPKIKFILQYSYSINEVKTSNSYFDKTSLYGENGILRDIQNRLENLKSNFEAMGFEYDTNDEFSSSIKTLTVNNATISDVILPKEIYNEELTSLAQIIDNIDERITELEDFNEAYLSGNVEYHNDGGGVVETIKETVGIVYKKGFLVYGYIKNGVAFRPRDAVTNLGYTFNSIYDITNITVEGNIPGPQEPITLGWLGIDDSQTESNPNGGLCIGKRIKLFAKENGNLDIETIADQVGTTGIGLRSLSSQLTPFLYFFYIIQQNET